MGPSVVFGSVGPAPFFSGGVSEQPEIWRAFCFEQHDGRYSSPQLLESVIDAGLMSSELHDEQKPPWQNFHDRYRCGYVPTGFNISLIPFHWRLCQ
jgi:hypothetical protein